MALPGSGAGRHRPAIHEREPPSSLALSGSSQPRLPVSLLSSSPLGHCSHRAEHWRHRLELHDHAARMAPAEAARPLTGGVAATSVRSLDGGPEARGMTSLNRRGKKANSVNEMCSRPDPVVARPRMPSNVTVAALVRAPCRSSALLLHGHGCRLSMLRPAPYRRMSWQRTFHAHSTA